MILLVFCFIVNLDWTCIDVLPRDETHRVVFDELHFSKFCDRLLTGTWFFDIHPPLGKLILAYGSYIMGYRPDPTFVIDKVGKPYPPHVKYYLMRYISAFFSVLTVPLTYVIARLLRLSVTGSVLSTASVLLDFMGLIEGRLILMDSQLLFFCQLSLALALLLWRTVPGSQARVVLLIATGVACGLALSIKHTALATPALIALVSFLDIHFTNMPLSLMECAAAVICGMGVYAGCFYVLFQAVHHTGDRYDGFMPLHFRRTLIGSNEYDPGAVRAPFHQLLMYLNQRMIASNANVKRRHNWESKWYDWIMNRRGILFHSLREPRSGDGSTVDRLKTQIYLIGNPFVVWLVLVVVIALMVSLCFAIRYRRSVDRLLKPSGRTRLHVGTAVFLLCGWVCNLVPYMLVDRAAFMYHYLPGMFYGQLLCGLAVDGLPRRGREIAVGMSVTLMAAALLYWAPWVYGLPLTDAQHARRRWLSRWN